MRTIPNVICPICGCVCDDLVVTVEGNKVVRAENACALAGAKFLNYHKDRNLTPMIREKGELRTTELQKAVERIAEMLVDAELPILYGWSLSSCEAQKVGIELAEEVGGVIDNQTSVCHGPTALGIHDMGDPTCTLGEVRHRADLIIYWGCNPEESHPRHMRRYSALSEGRFRKGRKDRKVILVDARRTPTARLVDHYIQVEPGQDYELMAALRMALHFEEIEQESVAGVPVEEIEKLAEAFRNCEFGILFFGLGLSMSRGKERNIDGAVSLVRDLNKWTKFSIMPMRGHFNVTGANEVLAWQTGFPYAVDLSHGYPWYNPGETSVVDILRRGESDAALIVGSDPLAHFPPEAARNLCKIPFGVVDPHPSLTALAADVVIPSAFAGIETGGTAYRMDGVPLPLKKVCEPPPGVYPDGEVVRMILKEVRARKR